MTNDDTTTTNDTEDVRDLVAQLVFGSLAAQTVRAAVRLRVMELIGDKERSAAEVAADAGARTQPMTRLLRALASLGLLREHTAGSFSLTPAGATLDPERPGSLTSLVRMFTEPTMLRAWEHLDDSVRTGDVAFDTIFGKDFFSHLKEFPDLSAEFNAAMSQASRATAAVLPHAFDFGRFTTVTDVGGGDGTLLSAVLREHPALTGVVHDTEEGLAQAPTTLERQGLTARCSLAAGDFFQSVPGGADVYLLKSIVHDWSDEQAVTILTHCREALPPAGRVLIVEPVLPEVVDAETAGLTYLTDLNMMVNVGGRERTRADFEEVCRRAGLALTSVTPLEQAEPFCLIEATAA
ncbi:methyltransferase [Streptomyces durmitorensis]|uniref:Methyltransferase n=1 Tax=Streptomyces durmitorensis TaxID=319947 RepID=A0ABY4Q889_9ACTN|nr:methyltransferase [Streptomyces durmitorensis]UQT61359.1 methyltransferase [Streptomyces durmitorensis]